MMAHDGEKVANMHLDCNRTDKITTSQYQAKVKVIARTKRSEQI